MAKSIQVSVDVYAAIWAARQQGESDEDTILRRVFSIPSKASTAPKINAIGFSDPRFGLTLPSGFEIFRTYLGVEYRAQAKDGQWKLLNTGRSYPSLNQLSSAIGTKVENAWNNWYYVDEKTGKRELVTRLRK